jgi:hypothetical protein
MSNYHDRWPDGVGPEERAHTQAKIRAETGLNSPLWGGKAEGTSVGLWSIAGIMVLLFLAYYSR